MNEAGILHTKDGKPSNITPQKWNKGLEIYQNDSSLNSRDLFPADMLIISERSNTESILRASKGTFNDTNHPCWMTPCWSRCRWLIALRLTHLYGVCKASQSLCLKRLNIFLASCISRTFTFYLPGNCKIVKMINAKRSLPKICQDYRDIAHRQDYRDKKTTSVEVPNDNHSVESRMNGLSHGLHEIPLIKNLCTTQDNHIKVPLAVPPGSGFVQSRLSQRLMDYQRHEVSELTM